jgi:uridine kinase
MCRRYDHGTGLFTARTRLECNDAVLVSGLHTLYQPALFNLFDLKVYLEVDEELRRAWKVARDTKKRGHSPDTVIRSIERRMPASERVIACTPESAARFRSACVCASSSPKACSPSACRACSWV